MVNIFKTIKELNLPNGEYVVVGSGIMGALGIREINDVDLCVSSKILQTFKEKDGWRSYKKWNKTFLENKGKNIDMFSQLAWEGYQTTREKAIETAEHINGVPFLNIEETIKFKEALGREKDMEDIKLLEECLDQK